MAKVFKLNAHGYAAEVVPEYGMNCIKILHVKSGADILRTPENIDVLQDSVLFGMPILFFPNRISNGKFEFEGREYVFPINEPKLNNFCHGDLHKLPFEVRECDDEHILGVFTATDEHPYMTFPHSFEFCVEYKIDKNGVCQTVSVKNTSDKNMPFALAFHTTFNLQKGDKIKLPVCAKVERNMATYLPTGEISKEFDLKNSFLEGEYQPYGQPISTLCELDGRELLICKKEKNEKISYTIDEKYKYCMVYSGDGKEYICLEPQTWLTNCPNLNLDRNLCGFDFIPPQTVKKYKSVIKIV